VSLRWTPSQPATPAGCAYARRDSHKEEIQHDDHQSPRGAAVAS
jgi:hypothetical protein